MNALMTEKHTHLWLFVRAKDVGHALVRRDEVCSCGATRVRVGYRWADRRR